MFTGQTESVFFFVLCFSITVFLEEVWAAFSDIQSLRSGERLSGGDQRWDPRVVTGAVG